jgi:hypothetical protein
VCPALYREALELLLPLGGPLDARRCRCVPTTDLYAAVELDPLHWPAAAVRLRALRESLPVVRRGFSGTLSAS